MTSSTTATRNSSNTLRASSPRQTRRDLRAGYFFLSGLEAIQDKLAGVKKLRLLIGNTTNRETIEQISEGYKRLELVEASEERERFLKNSDKKRRS